MKIKLLFLYGPLGGGGAERVLLDVLHNLDASRFEIDLCLMVNQGILLPEVPEYVRVIPLFESYNLYYKLAYRMSKYFNSTLLYKRVLRKKITKTYDYSISFLEGMPLKLHTYLEASHPKLTWVHVDLYHYSYTDKLFAKGEQEKAYQAMDAIVCVSNDTQTMFQQKFPGLEEKLQVIYNPIDQKKILAMGDKKALRTDAVFRLVSVGRLTEQKRLDRIIEVVARLKAAGRSVQLQLVGEGHLRHALQEQIATLGVANEVQLVGFQTNPYQFINQADVLVLPSASEGFGLVVVEAMVLGVPVISTRTAGPEEILQDNTYGLLCDQSVDALYEAVEKLMDNPELRQEYIHKGKERALDFSVENMTEGFYKLLSKIKG